MLSKFLPLAFAVLFILPSCASLERSLVLGSAVGIGVGATGGAVIGHNARSMGLGAAIGGATGLLVSLLLHKASVSRQQETATKALPEKIPSLSSPEVSRIWIPDKIEDNKYIEGHFIYVLQKNSNWIK